MLGNIVMFAVGYGLAFVIPARDRNLTNLTDWTQDNAPLD